MTMLMVLPEEALPVKFTLNPEVALNDDAYFEFCQANPEIRFERTSLGEITIVPPARYQSDDRNAEVIEQLRVWAKRDKRGNASGATTAFILPTGFVFSPDAAWLSYSRLSQFAIQERRKFLHVSPEFVVEVMSPSDGLPEAKEKMREWIRGGVELAWLIDADDKTVYIYRSGQSEPEARKDIAALAGEGPIAGFELDLTEIWVGL